MLVFDKIELNKSKRVKTEEGYLSVPANLARAGIYSYKAGDIGMTDRDPDCKVKVFRSDSEVFNADSMSSFELKPVTLGHPVEMVNVKNIKKYQVGSAGGQILRDGEFVTTKLLITDEDAIKAVDAGRCEVSNGYTAEFDFISGQTEKGECYDALQKNIRGNHIAIVDKARGGRGCRLSDEEQQEKNMKKIMFDGIEIEVTEQAEQAIGKLQTQVSDAKSKTKDAKDQAIADKAELQGKLDAEKQKVVDAESKVLDGEALDARIEQRAQLVTDAKSLVKDFDAKGKTDDAVREEVVMTVCDGVVLDGMEAIAKPIYVRARFDAALSVKDNATDGAEKIVIDAEKAKEDDKNLTESEKARKKFTEETENQYKGDK